MEEVLKIDRKKDWEYNVKAIYSQISNSKHKKEGEKVLKIFKKWLEDHPLKFPYFSAKLYWRAFIIHKELRTDDDHLTVICGDEGIGKSTIGLQFGAVVSPHSFSVAHVCYTLSDFSNCIFKAKKTDSIVCDEGLLFSFSREAISGANKMFVKLLSICRQLNLHIIINVPNFWNLESYAREHRVKSLLHITQRGFGEIYEGKSIKFVSDQGSKNHRYWYGVKDTIWKSHFKFCKEIPEINDFNKESYLMLKKKQMDEFLDELKEFAETSENEKTSKNVKVTDAANELNISKSTVKELIKKGDLIGKLIGGKWFIDRKSLDKLNDFTNSDDSKTETQQATPLRRIQ